MSISIDIQRYFLHSESQANCVASGSCLCDSHIPFSLEPFAHKTALPEYFKTKATDKIPRTMVLRIKIDESLHTASP